MSEKQPVKHLLGNRIAISSDWMPNTSTSKNKGEEQTKGGLILSPDAQKELEEERMEKGLEKSDRFRIVQVGTDCNELLKVGQEVMIEKAINVLKGAEPVIENHKIIAFIIPERSIAAIF